MTSDVNGARVGLRGLGARHVVPLLLLIPESHAIRVTRNRGQRREHRIGHAVEIRDVDHRRTKACGQHLLGTGTRGTGTEREEPKSDTDS